MAPVNGVVQRFEELCLMHVSAVPVGFVSLCDAGPDRHPCIYDGVGPSLTVIPLSNRQFSLSWTNLAGEVRCRPKRSTQTLD